MTRETPQEVDVMTAFCNKFVHKGKGSLETIAVGNYSTTRMTDPSTTHKEKKRKRRVIALTT